MNKENKNIKKVRLFIIGIIIIVFLLILFLYNSNSNRNSEIVLGFIAPLSGDVAGYGQDELNAIELALQKINSDGGINGKTVRIIAEDGKCSGPDALAAAKKLIDVDNVDIILGGACSGETLGIAPYSEEKKVILFSSISTSPEIRDAGKYIFRNAPSDTYLIGITTNVLRENNYNKVAIISENIDFSQNARKEFKSKYFGEIVADEVFETNSKDLRSQLTKIKSKDFDVLIVIPQTGDTMGLIAKQAREMGITKDMYSLNFFGDSAFNIAGDAMIGTFYVDVEFPDDDFLDIYLSKYSQPNVNQEVLGRYDSLFIIKKAMEYCNTETDTDCISNYLYNMDYYNGVVGYYKFDRSGDVVLNNFTVNEIIDGNPKNIKKTSIVLN
jgi:branched-chain amino acid transport system substrate-binding protein